MEFCNVNKSRWLTLYRIFLDSLRACNNCCDRVRGAIPSVEHGTNGVGGWALGASTFLIRDLLYIFVVGGLLSPPWSGYWQT